MSIRKIGKLFWQVYENDKPICSTCNKELKTGDYIDHFYPYYVSENICCECLEKEKK